MVSLKLKISSFLDDFFLIIAPQFGRGRIRRRLLLKIYELSLKSQSPVLRTIDAIKELQPYQGNAEMDIRYLRDMGFVRFPSNEYDASVFCEISGKGVNEIEINWVKRNFQTLVIILNFILSVTAIYVTLKKP
jgi:hypothetical protein